MSGLATDDAPTGYGGRDAGGCATLLDADLANANKFWFYGGQTVDKEVKEKFGDCLELAYHGKLDYWKSTPRGRVALILVLDQFSRNCYRDLSRSFAQDDTVLQITLHSAHCQAGFGSQLSNPLKRYFLYMPLMHSESLELHAEAWRLFQSLADAHKDDPEIYKFFEGEIKIEKAHLEVLTKFGMYPSRNARLGRKSTPDEEHLASAVIWPMED